MARDVGRVWRWLIPVFEYQYCEYRMALNLNTQYPGRTAGTSTNYPYGLPRNVTTDGDGTGTPFESAWFSDVYGFLQAVLRAGGIVPSGTPDNATTSQYLQALQALYDARYERLQRLVVLYNGPPVVSVTVEAPQPGDIFLIEGNTFSEDAGRRGGTMLWSGVATGQLLHIGFNANDWVALASSGLVTRGNIVDNIARVARLR